MHMTVSRTCAPNVRICGVRRTTHEDFAAALVARILRLRAALTAHRRILVTPSQGERSFFFCSGRRESGVACWGLVFVPLFSSSSSSGVCVCVLARVRFCSSAPAYNSTAVCFSNAKE